LRDWPNGLSSLDLKVKIHDLIKQLEGKALSLYRQSLENNQIIDTCILGIPIPGGIGGKETAEEILSSPEAIGVHA